MIPLPGGLADARDGSGAPDGRATGRNRTAGERVKDVKVLKIKK